MASYIIQGETLKAIADEVRDLADISDEINPNEMIANMEQANADVATQTEIIAQIRTALDGKAGSSEDTQVLIKKAKTHDWIQEHFINYKKTAQSNLFANNPNITEIPEFDFSQVINFYRMFYNCSGLTSIPSIDTSSGENFGEMFRGCTSLLEIPPLNTSKGTNMTRMFNNFKGVSLPWVIDTTNVITFERMFEVALNLEEVTLTSTHNGTSFISMFAWASKLKSISTFDLSNCTDNTNMFVGCSSLENISFVPETIKLSITIPSANLTIESKQSIFDGLATVETAQTLTLNANLKILQSQVDSANAKGWTVAGGTVVSEEEYYG